MGQLEVNNKLSHVVISAGLYTLPLQQDGMCTNALCKCSCVCFVSRFEILLLAAGVACALRLWDHNRLKFQYFPKLQSSFKPFFFRGMLCAPYPLNTCFCKKYYKN